MCKLLSYAAMSLIVCTMASAEETANTIPSTVSKRAQELIREITVSAEEGISFDDSVEAWNDAWKSNEGGWDQATADAKHMYPADITKHEMGGIEHLLITPASYHEVNGKRLIVYIHGGAHTFFSPESTLVGSLPAAHFTKTKVLAVRYPLAWQEPHPGSRYRVISVFRELLESYSPQHIAMYGDSAGGGALMSAVLKIRDDGLPMPAVLGLISPWADIAKTGDSYTVHEGDDLILHYEGNLKASAKMYAKGQDMKDPSISPIYADFTMGFPPSFITSGTRDLFLSNAVRVQRKLLDAGIQNQPIVYEGMWHVFQELPDPTIPEAAVAWRDMANLFEQHWAR